MMLQKKYIGAYSKDTRDYFSLLPKEQEIVDRLKKIYREEKGIFVLCGNRGAGKSSLKNISLESKKFDRVDKKTFIINVSFFSGNKDFHREILMQIPEAISKRIEEIETDIVEVVNDNSIHFPTSRIDVVEKIKEYDQSEQYHIDNTLSSFNRRLHKIKDNPKSTSRIYDLCKELLKNTNDLFEAFNLLNEQSGFQDSKKLFKNKCKNKQVDVSVLRKKIYRLAEKVDNLETAFNELRELQEFLDISSQQLHYFDIEIEDTKEYIEKTTSEVSATSSIDMSTNLGIVKSGINLMGKVASDESKESSQKFTFIVTEELKERQLLKLLKNMSEYFNITFSIDELDKCSTATIIDLINRNKMLFFDCNVSTLLITDVSTAISLEEESDYITEPNIIVVPDLTVLDYIYRANSKGMALGDNFIDILDSYFMNKMNNRELNYSIRCTSRINFPKGFELYKFMNSNLYRDLNELYKSIVLKFYWELLDMLDFVRELSKEEYEQFENNFLKKLDLQSLKVKFIIRKIVAQLTTQSFEYFFILEDDRSRYRYSKALTEFNNKKYDITNFLKQLALQPTILSDDTAFLKINIRDCQTQELYRFKQELSDFLREQGLDDRRFRNILLELSKPRIKSISNKKPRFEDKFYNPSQGVDDARDVAEREDTVGVILFYPYDHSENADPTHQPLRNGIIVTVNDFDEVVLYPYLGYIGLHSHKPIKLDKFKVELSNCKIPIYEIKDDSLWNKCFENDNKELEDKIFEVCEKNIDIWLQELKEQTT
ncbi:TPA: exonuclease SbcC [Streptococcus suis]|nr:exonuclease SbcC [Streptococcus suis]